MAAWSCRAYPFCSQPQPAGSLSDEIASYMTLWGCGAAVYLLVILVCGHQSNDALVSFFIDLHDGRRHFPAPNRRDERQHALVFPKTRLDC